MIRARLLHSAAVDDCRLTSEDDDPRTESYTKFAAKYLEQRPRSA